MPLAAAAPLDPAPSAAPPRARRLPPWTPLLVLVVAWAAHASVLRNQWVWDDEAVVRKDPDVARGVAGIPRLLVSNWFGETEDVGLFRPLVGVTLALEVSAHGSQNAFGFHLTNLFLHALAAYLLLAVFHRLAPRRPVVGAAAALLFAAHPLHTGTVSWIVARGDLLVAVFGCLAVLAWFRPASGPSTVADGSPVPDGRPGVSIADAVLTATFVLLACLSKESGVVVPAAIAAIDTARRRRAARVTGGRVRTPWLAYAGLLVPLGIWFVLRQRALGRVDATTATAALAGRNVFERFFVGAGAALRAAWKTFLPVGLSGDASDDPVIAGPSSTLPFGYVVAAALAAFAALACLVSTLRGRAGLATAAVGLFLVLFAPTMQIVPLGAVFDDRFAYVPSLALLGLAGLAAEAIARGARRPAVAVAAGVVVLACAGAASWAVAADWRDEPAFDEALLRDSPAHAKAVDRLGRWHLVRAQEDRARAATYEASDPRRAAGLASARAHTDRAIRLLEGAVRRPGVRASAGLWRSLADAYVTIPDLVEEAEAAYRRVLEAKQVRLGAATVPAGGVSGADMDRVVAADRRFMSQTWHNLGIALVSQNQRERAADAYVQATRWDPRNFAYRQRAAAVLLQMQDFARALPQLVAAERLAPVAERAEAHRQWAEAVAESQARSKERYLDGVQALARPGGQAEALKEFEAAVEIRPNFPEAWHEAARLHRYRGNLRRAIDYAERALEEIRKDAEGSAHEDADLVAKIEKDLRDWQAEFGR